MNKGQEVKEERDSDHADTPETEESMSGGRVTQKREGQLIERNTLWHQVGMVRMAWKESRWA